MDAIFETAKEMIVRTILRYIPIQPELDRMIDGYCAKLLSPSSGMREIWADMPFDSAHAACFTALYKRINTMAVAYRNPDSGHYLEPELLEAVRRALRGADRYWYHAELSMEGYDNWWHFTIGTPEQYTSALACVWDALSVEERARYAAALNHFCDYQEYCCVKPKGTHQCGANLVNLSTYEYRMGVLTQSKPKIEHALMEFAKVFSYVDQQPDESLVDGFYSDGSFLQHGVPYNVNYGREFLGGVIRFFETTSNTEWELGSAHYARVNEWIDRGIAPFVFRADAMDLVSGRAIVRKRTDKTYGYELGRYILHYAALLQDSRKQNAYFEMVKGWFLSSSPLSQPTLTWETGCDPLSRSIIENPEIQPEFTAGTGLHLFPNMDRVVYRPSPEWALGLSMCSSRIPTYELTNGENAKGWYTGSGMTSLYLADDAQYTDDYWWTVDMTAMPGTTVAAQPRYHTEYQDGDGEGCTSQDFVGGVRYGENGIAAMQSEQLGTPEGVSLSANKSWFLLEGEVVCLGSGISGRSETLVYTTVENRRVNGGGQVAIDGAVYPLRAGKARTLDGVQTAWVQGDGPGSGIGYYFPGGVDLSVLYEARRGDPGESCLRQTRYPERPIREYVKLQISHGAAPENAAYAYVLLPGLDLEKVRQYAVQPAVRILRQEETCHAVYHEKAGLLGMVNFSDSPVSVATEQITAGVDRAVLLMVSIDGSVSVSDPARRQTGEVTVTLRGDYRYPDSDFYRVSHVGGETVLRFRDLASRQGCTVTARTWQQT